MVTRWIGGAALALVVASAVACAGGTDKEVSLVEVWTTDDPAVLMVQASRCNEPLRFVVEETDQEVTITAHIEANYSSSDDCLGSPEEVPLAAPLGDRAVVDGTTDATMRLTGWDPEG